MKVVALMFLTNCFCLITGFIIGKFIYKEKNKKVIDTPFGKNIKFTTKEQFTDVSEINFGKKSLRPQNKWKPSDEMLKALYRAIPENTMEISEDEMLLDKLYQGLKYGRVVK